MAPARDVRRRAIAWLALGAIARGAPADPPAPWEPEAPSATDRRVPPPQVFRESAAGRVSVAPFARVTQVNVNPQGLNIVGDAANEPSLAVDPNNRNRIAAGWRQFDSVTSSFRQAGVAWSRDGGESWNPLPPLDAGVFRSDPVLESDANGVFYYNSLLGGEFSTWIYRSLNGGRTWGAPTFAFGGDKQWMAIDKTDSPSRGRIYQAWNIAGNNHFPATFNRSPDAGQTWTQPTTIPARPIFGTLTVGRGGEVFILGAATSGSTELVVVRALNAGHPTDPPVFLPAVTVPLGGAPLRGIQVNPGGLAGQLIIDQDRSTGPFAGRLYALGAVDPPGADPADVHLCRSDDNGATWSPFLRVNDDTIGAYQWFATMSVAPDGRVDVAWNDTRNGAEPRFSEIFYAFSLDGGASFSPAFRLTLPYDSLIGWPQQNKIGDYWDMDSDIEGADLIVAATWNGEQDVYHIRITPPICADSGRDCNANSVNDECEIQVGLAFDANQNAIPDECETPSCLADTDRSGTVDFDDITRILEAWASSGAAGRIGDASADGRVDLTDVTVVLQRWLQTCP